MNSLEDERQREAELERKEAEEKKNQEEIKLLRARKEKAAEYIQVYKHR